MKAAVAYTDKPNSREAGLHLADQVQTHLNGKADAIILFAAPQYDHAALLKGIEVASATGAVIGASSAGEFTGKVSGVGSACVLALSGGDAAFSLGVGRGLRSDTLSAARQIISNFRGDQRPEFRHRAALVMTDALAGHADLLVDELTVATAGQCDFFGGGAGDNANFQRTSVFCGGEVLTDAAVALEILSHKPIGIGVSHGWEVGSRAFRVTETDGMRLISLDSLPAVQAFEEYAKNTRQLLDHSAPIPFFLQNILGIETGAGQRLRVPLAIDGDGAVMCAAEIPVGSIVHIMRSTNRSAVDAAERAADAALATVSQHPAAALFFDCVATRLRLGTVFGEELAGLQARLGSVPMAGCNTHGQIARAQGQFEGFHNCTAVVCVFPQ